MSQEGQEIALGLLQASQSSDHNIRSNAESQLNTAIHSDPDSTLMALTGVARNAQLDTSTRQLALLILNRAIPLSWSLAFEQASAEPNAKFVSQQVKQQLRSLLLELVSDPQRRVRSAAAYAISKIATVDYPDEWPSLLGIIIQSLTAPTTPDTARDGALQVLQELLEDTLGDEQFFPVARHICTALQGIASNKITSTSYSIRAKALATMRIAISLLDVVDKQNKDLESFLNAEMPGWMETLIQGLNISFDNDGDYSNLVTFKCEIVSCIKSFITVFPKQIGDYVMDLFSAFWPDIGRLTHVYDHFIVKQISDETSLDDQQDPTSHSIKDTTISYIETLKMFFQKKVIVDNFSTTTPNLGRFIWLACRFGQITQETKQDWEADVNGFVSEEMDLSSISSVRLALSDLIDQLPSQFSSILTEWILSQAQEKDDYSLLEANLFILQQLLCSMDDYADSIEIGFITNACNLCSSGWESGNHFLASRAILVAGKIINTFNSRLGDQKCNSLLRLVLDGCRLQGKDEIIVRMSGFLSIRLFINQLSKDDDYLKVYQEELLVLLFKLIPFVNGDSVAAVLESLAAIVSINYKVAIESGMRVITMIFLLISKDPSNIQVTSDVHDIMMDIVIENSENYIELCRIAIPPLATALEEASDDYCPETVIVIDLLTVFIEEGPTPLPIEFSTFIFQWVYLLLLSALDNDILQNATECLVSFIKHDSTHIKHLTDVANTKKSGIQCVLDIISRLLGQQVDESSSLYCGKLINALIEYLSNDLSQVLPHILEAVSRKLEYTETPLVIQGLLGVFAKLLVEWPPYRVVEFLAGVSVNGTDKNGLQVALEKWVDNYEIFRGDEDIKRSTIALIKIFMVRDPGVESMIVNGDLIVNHNKDDKIVTRSMAKKEPPQYYKIPMPVKIFKLLLKELALREKAVDKEEERVVSSGITNPKYISTQEEWEDFSDQDDEDLAALAEYGEEDQDADVDNKEMENILRQFFHDVSARYPEFILNMTTCNNQGYLTVEEKGTLNRALSGIK